MPCLAWLGLGPKPFHEDSRLPISIIVEHPEAAKVILLKKYSHPALKDIALADVMQALSDPCRLAIVRALISRRGRELACADIPLRVAKATRSHHFDVLRDAGIISSRCAGTKCLTILRRRELDRRFPGLLKLIARREEQRP
jgi:DNA-binding transcriptional ArsR family regulator